MIFDHIGLFVRDLADGRQHLSALLGIVAWTDPVDDPTINVRIQLGTDSSAIRYELIAPLGPGSPADMALASGNNLLDPWPTGSPTSTQRSATCGSGDAFPPPRPARR